MGFYRSLLKIIFSIFKIFIHLFIHYTDTVLVLTTCLYVAVLIFSNFLKLKGIAVKI